MNTFAEVFCICGMILAHEGNKQRAIELFSLIYNHPDSTTGWLDKWTLFAEYHKQLKIELGEETYNQAWEHGKTLDLETTVNDLLKEFSIDSIDYAPS